MEQKISESNALPNTLDDLKYLANPRNIVINEEKEYKGFGEKKINNKQRSKCKLINKKEYKPEWMYMKSKLFTNVCNKMADSLIEQAIIHNVDLSKLSIDNFNDYLDDVFNDGGEIRCESFTDLASEYSLNYASFDSVQHHNLNWKCIEEAIKIIQQRIANGT